MQWRQPGAGNRPDRRDPEGRIGAYNGWATCLDHLKRRFYVMSLSVETLRRQVETPMRQRGVVRAGVFGSVARGDDKAGSDVDFLVEFERGRSLLDLAGLRAELSETLGREVDIVTRNSLHPRLRDRILRELVPLL